MNIEFLKEKLLDGVNLDEKKVKEQKKWLNRKIRALYTDINTNDDPDSFNVGEFGLFCFLLFDISVDFIVNGDDFKKFIKK